MNLDASVMQQAVDRLCKLIAFPTVSSQSNRSISDWISDSLREMGFEVEQSTYLDSRGTEKVNVVARRNPTGRATSTRPGLAHFGHTDVVPVPTWNGPTWNGPTQNGSAENDLGPEGTTAAPFTPVIHRDRIYGRGSCDMKGSIAAMMTAAQQIPVEEQTSPLWIVCTADEEVGFHGARHVANHSDFYRDLVKRQPISIIGEPTQLQVIHAHKGVTGFEVTSRGKSAHSSTREGINANEALIPLVNLVHEIAEETRTNATYHDQRFDPPHLSWNYGVRNSDSAVNITTELASVWVSLRTMPEIDGESFIEKVRSKANELKLEFKRYAGGSPFWVDANEPFLSELCEMTGQPANVVCYATDGGVFSQLTHRVVLGPGSIDQAHTSDEWISLDQLGRGTQLYTDLIRRYCCS